MFLCATIGSPVYCESELFRYYMPSRIDKHSPVKLVVVEFRRRNPEAIWSKLHHHDGGKSGESLSFSSRIEAVENFYVGGSGNSANCVTGNQCEAAASDAQCIK